MNIQKYSSQKGMSLIEILIAVSIFITLISFTTLSLLNVRSKTSVNTSVYSFITDLKNQQIKAMTGDTEGRGVPDVYGIYITPITYTLFHGLNYSFSNTYNFVINVPDGYQLSTTFLGGKIVFASGSGELVNYNPNQNSVTFQEISSGLQKIIRLNPYGVVTSVQ